MAGKYYWLKLKKGFFKRHDIRIIESMENGKDYVLFYLKLLCESVDHNGNLRFSDQIPYSPQMLATITGTNVDIVKAAIDLFSELGMLEIMDDGTYFMREVEKMIGSCSQDEQARESTRLRVQAHRNRQKQALLNTPEEIPDGKKQENERYSNVTVTLPEEKCNVTCNGEKEIDIEKDIDIDIDIKREGVKHPSPRIPYAEIVEEYNSVCKGLPKVTLLNDRRRRAIKNLYSNKDIGPANISLAFRRAQESEFLKGKNDRGWKANFDWIMNPTNITKILEGNYDSAKFRNILEWAED